MTKFVRSAVLAGVLAAVASGLGAQGKGKPVTYPAYNVTTTISNADASGAPTLLQSDTIAATYTATSGVGSFVGGSTGEWQLDLSQQTYRTVYLNFSAVTPNAGSPAIPVANGYYAATIFTRCYDASGNLVSLLNIGAYPNDNCSLRINFSSAGNKYSFVMAPAAQLPANAPATGRASVGCTATASDGSGCASWTITPSTVAANTGFADLLLIGTHSTTVIGSYRDDRFQIALQR